MDDEKRTRNVSSESIANSGERPLQSWKEIGAYLERDERTAQRWEKEEGLPIRRHREGRRGSVYAYPGEIEAWRLAREPKTSDLLGKKPQQRRNLAMFAAVLTVLFAAWFLIYSPILNPPNPLVEADGVTMRQVWSGPESDSSGTPSPDGRYLSFVDWKTGDLALRDLVTEENRRLTNKGTWAESTDFALDSIFSPDGTQIVYTWFKEGLASELRLINVESSIPHVLYGGEGVDYVRPYDWMPDGGQVLVVGWQKDRTAQIGLVSIPEGTFHVLKTLDRCFPFQMSLSPDGRYAVYDVPLWGESTSGDLFLLSTETGREIPLVQHPAQDLYPVWTPDSRAVVFASDRTGTLGLWSVQVADGRPQAPPS